MINGFGPAYGYLGYQVHTRKFFQALNRLSPVCLVPTNPNYGAQPVPQDVNEMVSRQRAISLADPSICISYGNDFHRFNGSYRVGYTVFEYTKLADDWLNGMRQVDEIWTTSQWGHDVIRANGLTDARVSVVPEGFDPTIFNPSLRPKKKDGVFRFLTVGKWEVRKGQIELLTAWAKAFRGIKDVELILMCNNPFVPNFSIETEIKKLNLGSLPPTKSIKNVPTDVDMAKYYAEADCFVLPTRAEGWGLPIMEAMACGTPVITTRYSAMTDYANDENSYLLDVKRMSPVFDPLFFPRAGESGEWAEIDVAQLAEYMLFVYKNRGEAARKGERAAADMAAQWTWDRAAIKANEIVEQRCGPRGWGKRQ
ncbi:MAG TPA: glycosyltransferase family 4 protein [Rhodocyclaceae bacterium]|nr:glycosyltransferase family 4 protein [Rhodocyclaceae bacterium]